MPYVPRAAVAALCAHCGVAFAARHLRRKYCCNSCNVLAARARQRMGGRPVPPVADTVRQAAPQPAPLRPLMEHLAELVGPVTPVDGLLIAARG